MAGVEVVWFKRDLRTTDHAPLAAAAAAGPVLPLYVAEPGYWAQPSASRRQWCAVADALAELAVRLGELGAPLQVREGDAVAWLARIHARFGIARLHAHQETGDAWTHARDRRVRAYCRASGIAFLEYPHGGVQRGPCDRDRWASEAATDLARAPVAEPARLAAALRTPAPRLPTAADLGLGDDGCAAPQPGGRQAALALLEEFLDGRGADYRAAMATPLAGARACSRLSVALATGSVSVREVLARVTAARAALAQRPSRARAVPLGAIDSLVSRLYWRGHFIQKLESEPELEWRSLHPAHERARRPTPPDDARLEAYAQGRTGVPFVDACLRSLRATGWINFRMRAMLQSFASHTLGLDWRPSGLVLARLFTDYEPGIHWPQVQMQAAQTGINVPRLYNPVKQGEEQDPQGTFTRRWVPELAGVPGVWLQRPWQLDAAGQVAAGCRLGSDYPWPVVDLAAAAAAARARLAAVRAEPGYRSDAEVVYRRHGSRRSQARRTVAARRAASGASASAPQLTLDL